MKYPRAIVTVGLLWCTLMSLPLLAEPPAGEMVDQVKEVLAQEQARQLLHMHFSTDCFNNCWNYIEMETRTEEDVENMLLLAGASLWHWKQREDCTPENLSVAYWQLGRVNCLAGNLPLAKHYGQKCLDISLKDKLTPFFIGCGYEVMADAFALDNKPTEAEKHLELAKEQLKKVQDEFERDLLKADLDRIGKRLEVKPAK